MEIAIDIGYGHTKLKSKDKELKFPTAIELVKTQWIETDNYSFEGKCQVQSKSVPKCSVKSGTFFHCT